MYSSSVSVSFNSWYSFAHCARFSSNASGIPPQPTYFDRISCSCQVAFRSSVSSFFNIWMASILARNFCFGLPSPKCSSEMRKLIPEILSRIGFSGSEKAIGFSSAFCPDKIGSCSTAPFCFASDSDTGSFSLWGSIRDSCISSSSRFSSSSISSFISASSSAVSSATGSTSTFSDSKKYWSFSISCPILFSTCSQDNFTTELSSSWNFLIERPLAFQSTQPVTPSSNWNVQPPIPYSSFKNAARFAASDSFW